MKPISNRYELKQLIAPIHGGLLYEGKDLSLQRPVFVYAVELQGEGATLEYISRLGSAAQQGATDSPFLHVLDIEIGVGYIHVIISYKPGCSLKQFVQTNAPTYSEAVAMVFALGQSLLDAAETRTLDISLDSNNIWITEDGTILVIVSWGCRTSNTKLSKEISQLFVQLAVRSDTTVTDGESIQSKLIRAIDLPLKKKEEAAATITDALQERVSLAYLIQHFNKQLNAPSSEANRHEQEQTVVYDAGPFVDNAQTEHKPRSRLFQFGKKLWIGIALSGIGIVVFAGMFVLLVETMNRGGNKSDSKEFVIADPAPQSPVLPQKTAEDKTKEKEVSQTSNDQPIVDVPTLTGLTKEAAEKKALDTGLRYKYFLVFDTLAAGTVLRQEPAPNEQVAKGSSVSFWISKGPSQ